MRKIFSTLICLLALWLSAFSQTRTVTGKVTDKDGNPIPFSSVKIKGVAQGAFADANGGFSVKVKGDATLQITATGYIANEVNIGQKNFVGVVLQRNADALVEVVVTSAFQTKRTQRSTTSNAQLVTGDAVNTIRQANVNNALAGKVAGIQVRSQSVAQLDGGATIRLGGESGFQSGSVLYVVDGTQMTNVNDISPDDIQDYTVLQGPAAAALYGPAGQNGVIVITLKKAAKFTKGIGLELNSGITFDKIYILPNYQNSYAGGSQDYFLKYTYKAGDPIGWKALDGKYYSNYDDDASWGPRMSGQEYIPWYAWYDGSEYSYKTAKLTPQPKNTADFYNTGVTMNNNVNFSKIGDGYNFRASYSNFDVKGVIPTTTQKRNMFSVNGSIDLNNHLTFSTNINYVTQDLYGLFNQAYSNQTTGSFNSWFHRDLDMNIMRQLQNLTTPYGTLASWNLKNPDSYDASNPTSMLDGNYWYNPYSYLNNKTNFNRRDRLYGNAAVTYKVNNDLSFKLTYRKSAYNSFNEAITTSQLEKSATQTGEKASYSINEYYWNKQNIEGLASYNKKFRNLSLNVATGFDLFTEVLRLVSENTNGGLNVDNFYSISNSKLPASYSSNLITDKYRAVFGTVTFGFKNYLFFDATARQDYFSTLPPSKPGIFSKSLGASFVFSDLLKKSIPFLSYGKLKASWGEVPGALGPFDQFYGAYNYPGALYTLNANQWNGNILSTTPNGLTDPNIHGAVAVEKDLGLELSFLKSRLGFTVLYKSKVTKDFPLNVTVNGASGITTKLLNTGEIDQNSIDVTFNAKPIRSKNFDWELNATFSKNVKDKVISIAPGVTSIPLTPVSTLVAYLTGNNGSGGGGASFSGITTPTAQISTGFGWGALLGGGYKVSATGKPVLDASGFYIKDTSNGGLHNYGSVLPQYTGGVQNTFNVFKNFVVNINIDYQVGGKFFSLSDMWGSYSGLTARTAILNDKGNPIRDPVADGGGIHVFGSDQTTGKDVNYYVSAYDYYHTSTVGRNVYNDFIYNLTFVKLREFSIGYKFPLERMGRATKYINSATFSIVARNPWLIYAQTKDFDPSEVTSVYGENGQYPGTRSMGFNLKIGF